LRSHESHLNQVIGILKSQCLPRSFNVNGIIPTNTHFPKLLVISDCVPGLVKFGATLHVS